METTDRSEKEFPIETQEEYDMALEFIMSIARTIQLAPTEKMLNMISRSEAVGPIIDPTLWIKASQNNSFDNIKKVVSAANDFKRAVLALKAKHEQKKNET